MRKGSFTCAYRDVHCSTISWMALVGSISIAKRLSKPLTFVASFENFWPNASDKLCAGSVDCVQKVNLQVDQTGMLPSSQSIGRIHGKMPIEWRGNMKSWSFLARDFRERRYAMCADAQRTDTTLSTCKANYQTMNALMWLRDVPQKIHLSDFCSRIFCSVGSSTSSAMLTSGGIAQDTREWNRGLRRGRGKWHCGGGGGKVAADSRGTHLASDPLPRSRLR